MRHAGTFRRAVPVFTLGDGGVSGADSRCPSQGRMSGRGWHDGLSRSASRPPSPAGVGPHDRGSPGPPEGPQIGTLGVLLEQQFC